MMVADTDVLIDFLTRREPLSERSVFILGIVDDLALDCPSLSS